MAHKKVKVKVKRLVVLNKRNVAVKKTLCKRLNSFSSNFLYKKKREYQGCLYEAVFECPGYLLLYLVIDYVAYPSVIFFTPFSQVPVPF